ncbi:hypothetical protein FPSE5266_06863 [Fusarium pseudograminearum]|nr:hypothetical protein FPSE5266_06863 [Fusarium pseudograminearum]
MEGPSRDPQRSDILQEVRDEKPAADGGLVAWLGVVGAWLMFFITWGPAGSFGVFEAYYKSQMLSSYSESTIAWIGSVSRERLGMNWLISGLGTLLGAPIAGTLSRPESGQFLHAQIFTGCIMINWGGSYGEIAANNYGLSRKHIIEGLDASLERMGLSYVDLVYAHRPDRKTPIEEIVRAFNHVINMGKAFYWGTSQWSADEIATAWRYADKLGLIGPTMEQPEYNMLTRTKVESEFVHLYREVGTGLTVFSPLAMGLLTGKYNDGIPDDSRLGVSDDKFVKLTKSEFGNEEGKKMLRKIARLKPVAESLGTSQAILALAWVLKNKNVSSAITGASRPEQIQESVKVFSILPKLTDEIMQEIDNILENRPTPITSRFI